MKVICINVKSKKGKVYQLGNEDGDEDKDESDSDSGDSDNDR